MTIGEDYTPPGQSGHRGQGRQGQGHHGHRDNPGSHPDDDRDDRPGHRDPIEKNNVNWDRYDVPIIWQMVASEGSYEATDLVDAFNKLSQFIDATRLRLADASKELALAWTGAAASDSAQALITELTDAMVKDTTAYRTATGELDNVVMRLTETKQEIEPLYQQWMRLYNISQQVGQYSSVVTESNVFLTEVEHTNAAAREEMRRLDRDLSGARITTTDDFVPSTGVPTTDDLQLAGLGPQAIEAAQGGGPHGGGGGGGLGRGLLSGGLPPTAAAVPGGGLGGVGGVSGMAGPMRPAMPGVIGGDATSSSNRPMAGGMMGGGAHGGAGGAGGEQGGGRADTQWETRHGVSPVIGGAPPPDPSTMGVDDSFDKQQRRK